MQDQDLLFLIGAGCSIEAGISTADQMIVKLEGLLEKDDWRKYKKLYFYIKNTLSIDNHLNEKEDNFNIESLLNILSELKMNSDHIIYPFTKGWNRIFCQLVGDNGEIIPEFIREIKNELPRWVIADFDQKKSEYYNEFFNFQKKYEYPLRIFSLNYDLCFEKNIPDEFKLEVGFDNLNYWNDSNFIYENISASIYLYKLHGSIDWYRDENNSVCRSTSPGIQDNTELIFGGINKVKSTDPYLFYLHEFRKYLMASKVVVILGYSLGDNHINQLLEQSVEYANKNNLFKSIIYVNPESKKSTREKITRVFNDTNIEENMDLVINKASDFLKNKLSIEYISSIFGSEMENVF